MRTTANGSGNRLAGLGTSSNPFALIDEMRREMDRVFDQVLGSWNDPLLSPTLLPRVTAGVQTWMPSMDVQETEKALRLTVELPGLEPGDLHVDVTDDVLTISGEKKVERDESEGGYRLVERRAGRFERRLTLPSYADSEHVTAEYEHGVLTIAVPKKAEAAKKSRRVEIKGGGALGKLLGRGKSNGNGHKDSHKDGAEAGAKAPERADA